MLSLFSIPGTTAKLHTDLQVVAEGTVPQDSVMPVQLAEADLADLSGNVPAGVARSDGPPTEKNHKMTASALVTSDSASLHTLRKEYCLERLITISQKLFSFL